MYNKTFVALRTELLGAVSVKLPACVMRAERPAEARRSGASSYGAPACRAWLRACMCGIRGASDRGAAPRGVRRRAKALRLAELGCVRAWGARSVRPSNDARTALQDVELRRGSRLADHEFGCVIESKASIYKARCRYAPADG